MSSIADCSGIQQDQGMSNSQTKNLVHELRLAAGSKTVVERYAFSKIKENNRQLNSFFKLEKLSYIIEEKDTKIPTIICSNLPGLVDVVLEKRQREKDSVLIKLSVDGGGGFLKICLSIFNIDNPTPIASSGLSRKFLESGVKKIFIIGLVPNVPENYVNVKQLWNNSGVKNLSKYTIATDLKLCNILLGMMSSSSCHPCPWCDIKKEFLHQKGNPRTLSSLMNLFWDFFKSKKDKSQAKKYGNVIHLPIFSEDIDDETFVISFIPTSELHLLIGPINKMYLALESIWEESFNWLKSCNVKKEDYHNGCFAEMRAGNC